MPLPSPSDLFHLSAWRRLFAWAWAGLVIVVAAAALTPGHAAPTLSPLDKLDHLLAFAALATTGALAQRAGWKAVLVVGVSMTAFGGLIELLQTAIPGRRGDWADLLADAAGIAIGLVLVPALRRAFRPRAW